MMTHILDKILTAKRREVEQSKERTPLASLETAPGFAAPRRPFRAALQAAAPAIIAELKKASPSKGVLRPDFDLETLCRAYADNGAAAISVLTEKNFFLGGLENLTAARRLCELPLLRKDFIFDEYQLFEARAAGADAVLLIVAALDQTTLKHLTAAAHGLELEVLIEAHDRPELDVALDAAPDVAGINNRNLKSFVTDLQVSIELAAHIPAGVCKISESGIRSHADVLHLAAAGFAACLVGETLVTAPNPAAKLRDLLGR
jgi:indole-3-glycerol phosphate synthase